MTATQNGIPLPEHADRASENPGRVTMTVNFAYMLPRLCPYFDETSEHGWHHPAAHEGGPCPYWRTAAMIYGNPDPADDVAEWRVDISAVLDAKGRLPITLNSRMHWAAMATAIKRIKAVVRNAVVVADVPHLDHVHVEIHYRPGSNRYRDADNVVGTLKPAIDALHTADDSINAPIPYMPIVDGDDPRYLTWSTPFLHSWVRGGQAGLWLILRSYA